MGIFDTFKKHKSKENEEVIENNEKSVENTISNEKEYTLTQAKCGELLQHIFKDEDHGDTMMREASLLENIFVLGYIENSIMPDCKKQGKENDYKWFHTVMVQFRKIFYDKVMNEDKLFKVMLKTTGFPFVDRGCEHILVCGDYKEHFTENLKKLHYDVEVIEISNEQLKNELNDLYRNGYKGMCFSDGVQRPYYFSKESIVKIDEVPAGKYIINPDTQYSMTAFFQEMRRNINYEGAEKIRQNLENNMIKSIINTRFVLPLKKSNVDKVEFPVYMVSENKENNTMEVGVYVFTDKIEMQALKHKTLNLDLDDGWDMYTYDFTQLMNLLNEAHITEICINCGSINFKVNEKSLAVLKKQSEDNKEEMSKKQEEWESIELPKMLKDKNTPIIKDSNGTPLFARKKDSVLISKYIYDILEKRDFTKEIMDFFFNDCDMVDVTLYDFDFRRITLKIKDNADHNGLFVMPMRYDDEDDSETINDLEMHYTEEAQKIKAKIDNSLSSRSGERTMHFYTIENKDTNKTYIPLFSDEKEAEKIYARNNYRYCMVSYKDVMDNVKPYDGVVINPASMSFVISKQYLDNIFDIENK